MTTDIRIGGFGGQGVILSGIIIGKSATIYEDRFATLVQSFGPEARGSACSAQVIISDNPIMYPYLQSTDILMVMSQEAYRIFSHEMVEDAVLIYESELVEPANLNPNTKTFGIPGTRFAEELGRRMVLNIVMVGFFTAVTKMINPDAMRNAVKDSVPPPTIDLNMRAFDKGYNYGVDLLKTK